MIYKHLLNSGHSSDFKQIFKFTGIIFSQFGYYIKNNDRDAMLLRDNTVTRNSIKLWLQLDLIIDNLCHFLSY